MLSIITIYMVNVNMNVIINRLLSSHLRCCGKIIKPCDHPINYATEYYSLKQKRSLTTVSKSRIENNLHRNIFSQKFRIPRSYGEESRCNKFTQQYNRLLSTSPDPDIAFSNPSVSKRIDIIMKEYSKLQAKVLSGDLAEEDDAIQKEIMSRLNSLQPLVEVGLNMQEKRKELLDLNTLIADSATDSEMMCAALEEKNSCEAEIRKLDEQVIELLLPNETLDDNDIILEVSAGIGGQEAMLFAQDMFLLYENYAAEMGWSFDIYEHVHTEIGGLRRASAGISGQCAYKHLKFESGVHRVQRVPKTEKAGRIHTSTVTVAIMPQPKEIDIVIHPKDITIECTRSSGKGGQSVNTTDSCVRIVHKPTGVVSECQTERSQMQNRERAMKVLRTRLYNVKVEKQQEEERSHRKLQVGSKSRSEKVRTYNYQQDRITDHRIGVNRFHIPEFMSGGSKFHDLVLALLEADRRERLVELLEKANNPNERS